VNSYGGSNAPNTGGTPPPPAAPPTPPGSGDTPPPGDGGSGGGTGGSGGDTTAPTVSLNGDATVTLTVGDSWSDPGATATDDVDGDISSNIQVAGSVDTGTAGTYTLTYSVTDAAGNTGSATRTVTVEDVAAPPLEPPPSDPPASDPPPTS
jgi:hypothetical protein